MKPGGRLYIAAAIALALWFGSGSPVEAQKPIRIGASASRTGAYATLGQNQLRGYQLCVKHTNERGGVLGRKLELVVDDDRSQAATAKTIYERLITQDKTRRGGSSSSACFLLPRAVWKDSSTWPPRRGSRPWP